MRLERLRAYWSKEHAIKAERRLGCPRHGQMAEMGRVKTASKKGYAASSKEGHAPLAMGLAALGVGLGTHAFILAWGQLAWGALLASESRRCAI